jgi:hypothetical protein
VTLVYWYKDRVFGHNPSPCFYLKHTTFRKLDFVRVFRWIVLSWAQSIELVLISRHQHKHKEKYLN